MGGGAAVNEDCLKLTVYFGEHDRAGHGLLADVLLEIYERHQLQSSILLRGIEGFGRKHALRTDRLLTMSEDLPVVAIAVDTRERIEAVAEEVRKIAHPGLVTLERARLITGETTGLELPEALHEATKLTLYIGRRDRSGREPLFVTVCELLHREGVSGAVVLLGVDGTRNGRRQRARLFGANQNVPIMIIAVGPGANIARALPQLGELIEQPTMTLERVQLLKRDGELIQRPPEIPAGSPESWQKLMIHASESARHDGHPLHRSLVRKLRRSGIEGATTLRGVWGFHGDHPPHGDRLLQLHRHVPTVTVVIDSEQRIAAAFEIIDDVTSERGLITSELVPIKYTA